MNSIFKSTFVRYFGSAFLAMLVNIATRFLYNLFLGFGLSVILSYITGHFVNFILSAKYIFKKDDALNLKTAFIKFSMVATLGLIAQFLVATLALYFLQNFAPLLHVEWQKLLAHFCGIGVSFFANFLGHKFFSFKNTQILQKFLKRISKCKKF